MRLGVAVAASGEELLGRMLAAPRPPGAASAVRVRGGPSGSTSRSRPGWAGPACRSTASSAAVRLVAASPGARLVGLWSHLRRPTTGPGPIARPPGSRRALGGLAEAWRRVPPRHLAAARGCSGGPCPPYDGVRIGLAIYGIVPDDVARRGAAVAPASLLRPVLSLHARPVRVADLPAGSGIGYGPSFTTARPSRIATLPARLRRRLDARPLEPGRGARARASACRSSGTSRWTPSWPT